jgi:exopolysaccharide biosynthesis polyprenyl glycosylphosphotransferase
VIVLDGISLSAGWAAGSMIAARSAGLSQLQELALANVAGVVVLGLLCASSCGLYSGPTSKGRLSKELAKLAKAFVATGVIVLASSQFFTLSFLSTGAIYSVAYSLVLATIFRVMRRQEVTRLHENGMHLRPVAIVGTNEDAFQLWRLLESHPEEGLRVIGVFGDFVEYQKQPPWVPLLGDISDVESNAGALHAVEVFIAKGSLGSHDLNRLCRRLSANGVHVQITGATRGIDQRRLSQHQIGDEPFLSVRPGSFTTRQRSLKRIFDLVLTAFALVVAVPILAIAGIAIFLLDGRPILFKQKRVGRDGEIFTMYKLRTMVRDAESHLIDLLQYNERQGPLFKLTSDPRVTRLGRFLRESGIDELPQLFNVLKGSMSLVGPRPALPSETNCFDPELLGRHRTWPGITGLWQVNVRDMDSFDSYHRLDLYYVENWSLGLDIKILARTVPLIATRVYKRLTSGCRARFRRGKAEGLELEDLLLKTVSRAAREEGLL